MVHFREIQRFRQPWLLALLAGLVLLFGYGLFQQLFLNRPWGDTPMPDRTLIGVSAAVFLFVAWFCMLRLVTEVRDDELHIHFVGLWRPRRIPFSKIRGAQAVTYRPIADYGGWGIRWGRKGMAYNVSGNRGVQLVLEQDKPLLIGSQHSEELAGALEQRIETLTR